MIIQIVDPFDATEKYNSLHTINTKSRGVTEINLVYNINSPNELNCIFNTNLPLDAYLRLKDSEFGIRIKKDDHDLLFVQDRSSKKIDSQGQISVRFYSSIYKALYSEPTLINTQHINKSGLATINLIQGFEFILISQDVRISLTAGANNNLDIINDIRKASGAWSYFDTGLYPRGDGTFKNRIIIGNYNKINDYSGIDKRFQTETLIAKNIQNIFSKNPVLLDVTRFYNGRQIKFVKAILETGGGAGTSNSGFSFTRTDYAFVDPDFPIVNINGEFYIKDNKYTGLEERFFIHVETLTANSDNGAGSQIYNVEDALRYLYRKAVYYFKTQQESLRIDCEMAIKKLTFPKYLKVNYTKRIRNNGKEYVIHDINEDILYTKLQFDLTKL